MNLKRYIPILTYLLLVSFLMFLYGFSSRKNSVKKIAKIEVEFTAGNNGFLTHQAVNKLLIQNNKPVKNQSKRVLDLHKLEQKILLNPYVEEVALFTTLQDVLKATVKQRKPIARIVGKTASYYIDALGVKVPLSLQYAARVPLVSGIKDSTDIKEITQLINIILRDDFFKKEIIAVRKTATKQYLFNVRSGNYKIIFGAYTNVKTKFKKLKAFYNKAIADRSIENYKTINVKYHNQVVCTK